MYLSSRDQALSDWKPIAAGGLAPLRGQPAACRSTTGLRRSGLADQSLVHLRHWQNLPPDRSLNPPRRRTQANKGGGSKRRVLQRLRAAQARLFVPRLISGTVAFSGRKLSDEVDIPFGAAQPRVMDWPDSPQTCHQVSGRERQLESRHQTLNSSKRAAKRSPHQLSAL